MSTAHRALASLVLATSLCIGACTGSGRSAKDITGPIAHVWVSKSGAVYLNREPTTIPNLDSKLKLLARSHGAVFYGREHPESNPNPTQDGAIKTVLDTIIANRLPVRLMEKDPQGEPAGERP